MDTHRPHRHRFTHPSRRGVALAVAVLVGLVTVAACGSSGDADATANRRWARDFCTGLSKWQKSTTTSSAAVKEYLKTPGVDPPAVKTKLTEYLQQATSATDELARDLARGGVPVIPKGKQATSTLKTGAGQVKEALMTATTLVSQLPVDDTATFTTGITGVNTTLSAGFGRFGEALDRVNTLDTDKQLVKAERAVPQCKSLIS